MVPNNDISAGREELIFSLDIGTRTIVGIIGTYENNIFKILDSEIVEHDKRNMYDGQIHDIAGVVKIVDIVKKRLESRLGINFNKVAIAAAGRALKTYRARIDREIDTTIEIDRRLIESLEMESIQRAQEALDENDPIENAKYYCVGYTVVNYYLDENFIENLEGHKGSRIGVDVLATFLPHVVVDSLYTVMNRLNLEVVNMTLEPIAAINVAIKKNLRLLNLALVDIGAGTSDIAITKDGTVVAYGMASIAGDEITESLAKNYLLDFDTSEALKVRLNKEDNHSFYNIIGIEHKLTSDTILDSIDKDINNLAREIADKIIEYNEKAPSAVFLIGGGAQLPRLCKYIAENLNIPEERVVVRSTEAVEDVEGVCESLKGPHAITPIGIAITAINNKYKDFLEVTVNEQNVKLFNSRDIKVSDALVLIGYNPRKLIPKKGESLVYYINGHRLVKKGELGEPARIMVNNKNASLEKVLKSGDIVEIIEATTGGKPQLHLYDAIDIGKIVVFNTKDISMVKRIYVNGEIIDRNIVIENNDNIKLEEITTIEELFRDLEIDNNHNEIYKNGELVNLDCKLTSGDVITTKSKEQLRTDNIKRTINLVINGEIMSMEFTKEKIVFVDVFEHIDFDLSHVKGQLILRVNGNKADYLQELNNGDNLEIYWKNN